MRLVFMGTGPFAVPSFKALVADGHEVALVVSRPTPPVRSRRGPPPAPVLEWATECGFEIDQPDSINSDAAVARVASVSADLLVVCDYGQILKPAALATARLGGINLHGSLLPAYRGAAPVQRCLLAGETTTGVSVIHMTPRLDGGPVIATRVTDIRDDETSGELEARLAESGVAATREAVQRLAAWDGVSSIGQPQDADRVVKAPRLSKQEAEVDWSRGCREIDCHVRGMQPWPIAFSFVPVGGGKPPLRVQIKEVRGVSAERWPIGEEMEPGQWMARLPESGDSESGDAESGNAESGNAESGNAESGISESGNSESGNSESGDSELGNAEGTSSADPAAVATTTPSGMFVVAGDGFLEVLRIQPAGKKEMTGEQFSRGYPPIDGTVLGP